MEKRKIVIGGYDTAAQGWTLAAWTLNPAELKTNYVDKPGGDGTWDLSTVLTDGQPRYGDRTLTVTLERSDGDRLHRKAATREMINYLDGLRWNIMLPDDLDYYLSGRVSVAPEYNDQAHAAVIVTAVCEPWLYVQSAKQYVYHASTKTQTATLSNDGRKAVVPEIVVSGDGAEVKLEYRTVTQHLAQGTYILPDLFLLPGSIDLTYSGSGTITISYREAVLE